MRMNTEEDVSCRTRREYRSKAEAKRALKLLRRRPGRRHLESYECKHCGLWHLGNPPGHQNYLRAGGPTLRPRHRPN